MGRFFFHIRMGGQVISDQEGSDLPDVAAARLEALAAARYILADAIRSGSDNIPEAFLIADGDGRELETVLLSVVLPNGLKHWADQGDLPIRVGLPSVADLGSN